MTEEELEKELKDLDLAKRIINLKIQLAQNRISQIRLVKELEEKGGKYVQKLELKSNNQFD